VVISTNVADWIVLNPAIPLIRKKERIKNTADRAIFSQSAEAGGLWWITQYPWKPSLGYILAGDHLESGMLWELNAVLKFVRCVVARSTFRSSEFILFWRWLHDGSQDCIMWLYGVLAGRSNVIANGVWSRLMWDVHSLGRS